MRVKLPGSIVVCRKDTRQMTELPAKALIAAAVCSSERKVLKK